VKPILVKLSEQTTLDDVASWPAHADSRVTFVLVRSSKFEPGAEGLALSYLASIDVDRTEIHVKSEHALPVSANEFFGSMLSSTFGFALIRVAKTLVFADSERNQIDIFRQFAGKIYDERRGVLGLGDRVEIIAFDPRRPVPRALLARAQSVDQDGLPLPSAFQQDLVRILAGMGMPEIASPSTLPTVISFVYELFLNTVQHGLPSELKRASRSTRGIALSKIVFNASTVEDRNLSRPIKDYLLRISELTKRASGIHVVCISVIDMGDGIQNTLANSASALETSSERLSRAFGAGESRKGKSTIERGLGLHKVLAATMRLSGRLQVISAGVGLTKDFSLGEDKLPSMRGAVETSFHPHFSHGTSVTLFVPDLPSNIDQRRLV
jgi:hypothetical protein